MRSQFPGPVRRSQGIALSRQGNRLAYAVVRGDADVWRIDSDGQGPKAGTADRIHISRRVSAILPGRQPYRVPVDPRREAEARSGSATRRQGRCGSLPS